MTGNLNFNGKGKTCDTIEPLDNSNEVTEMNYSHTVKARFLDRPNRFVAHVELDGQTETVHVKTQEDAGSFWFPDMR